MEERTGDDDLARRVELELASTKAFDMDVIYATATQGIVTLHGKVASNAESILAENTARAVEGVRSLVNNLMVSKAA